MKILRNMEKIGYRIFLEDDIGIQEEFEREKERLPVRADVYSRKLFLLIKLIFLFKILKKSPASLRKKKREGLVYPEWEGKRTISLKYIKREMQKSDVCFIDIWNVLLFTPFMDMEKEKRFLEILKREERGTWDKLEREFYHFSIPNRKLLKLVGSSVLEGKEIYLIQNSSLQEKTARIFIDEFLPVGVSVLTRAQAIHRAERYNHILYIGEKLFRGKKGEVHFLNYKNPGLLGEDYRHFPCMNPVQFFYSALMNYHFHAAEERTDFFYGIGYKYAGILTLGWCQWLEGLGKLYDYDRLLFLSRDCDILRQIYPKYFGSMESEYVKVSRRAISEVIFEDFPEEYADNLFLDKMADMTSTVDIKKVLEDFDLSFLWKYLKEKGIQENEVLDLASYGAIRDVILAHYQEIKEHLKQEKTAGTQYWNRYFNACRNVCIVDLGWQGTTIRYLQYLAENGAYDCKVSGAMLGARGKIETAVSISRGRIHTYLFSSDIQENAKKIPYNNRQIFCMESIFSAPEGSMIRYSYDEKGNVILAERDANIQAEKIRRIQAGARDFAVDFMPFIRKYGLQIQKADAWEPMKTFLDNRKMVDLFIRNFNKED